MRKLLLHLTLTLALPGLLVACSTGASATDVDIATGARLAADSAYRVIDVRTPAEFADGHLVRAENVDYQGDFVAALGPLPKDGRYLVYCRSGNRSTRAAAEMVAMGYTDVVNVASGGFEQLRAAGAPVAGD